MSENESKYMKQIEAQIRSLPNNVADEAVRLYAAKMEGFTEGFVAGQAYTQNKSA